MTDLGAVFDPESVGVVGATDREGAVGRALYVNLTQGYEGPVVPINPNRETVFDAECYPSIDAAPPVELLVVAVPPEPAIQTLEAAGVAGITAAVVVTAGFGETDTAGAGREAGLQAIAEEYQMTVIGPNSLGVMNTDNGLNATFGPTLPAPGSVALMSQSGAFVTAAIEWARDRGIGFNDVVSLGNKAVVDETDLLQYWGEDPGTDAVVAYLEGIDRGRAFIETAREVTQETPVVILKAGHTDAGARAAASHTGTIAGSDRVYEAAFEQAGVVRVDTAAALFDIAGGIQSGHVPASDGVAVVTNAGGPGVLAADAIASTELSQAKLTDATKAQLRETLPDGAGINNPVDVLGDSDATRIRRALEVVAADPGVGTVVALTAPTAVLSYDRLVEALAGVHAAVDCPLVGCLMGGAAAASAAKALQAAGVPTYADPHQAIASLGTLYATTQRRVHTAGPSIDLTPTHETVRTVLRDATDGYLGAEAMTVLDAYGIETPASEIVTSAAEATTAAERIGGPVAMKVVSPDIVHKSDIGGVETDVAPTTAATVYETLRSRVADSHPDARIHGIQVQEQIETATGTETIVGTKRDPQFGQVVLFGLGGIYVEIFDDTALRVGPLREADARAMIDATKAGALVRGARGRAPGDEEALVETLLRVSQLVEEYPQISELDINPLLVTPERAVALDLRLRVDPPE